MELILHQLASSLKRVFLMLLQRKNWYDLFSFQNNFDDSGCACNYVIVNDVKYQIYFDLTGQ